MLTSRRQLHLPLFVVVVVAVTMIEAMDPTEATEPATIPDEFLIVAETTSLRLVTPNGSLVRTIANTQTQRVVGVAHDVDSQTIFWTDTTLDAVVASNVDGTNVRTIVSRLVIPSGVAYDPSAKHVYFSDSSLDIIGVATLDGNYSIPLISTDLVEPRAIILQPSKGLMYWIDLGSKAKIERAFMSGNDRTALIEGYDLGWPNGLTISGERLYWMDGKADKMESSDLDGNDRQVMLTFSANIHPFGMAITSETIYFTDRYARVVYDLPMGSNLSESDLSVVTRTKATPYGLSLYRAGESATEVNLCSLNNGDCEQMCLAEPTRRICACSIGVLKPDGVSCGEPDTIIFLVENDDIHGYVLRNGALQPAIAPITTVKKPLSVTVDPTTEMLYVTDITDRAIFEVTKDGQKRLVLNDPPLSYADNIAVDHVSNVLYYTDRTANIIGVVSVTGDWRKTLIGGLDEPRGLKLDIAEGMIYWSDWGSVPKIERVSMTGERRQVLVSTLIVWPNGITLDLTKRLLYWADARLDRIEVCNFDGTNRRLIGTYSQVHPYALDIYGDLLIWSDWQHNKIGSVKLNGSDFKVFVAPHVSFRQPTGLSVYNSSAPIATSACLDSGCSSNQVCVPRNSTSYQCACKFGNYNSSTEKCDRPSQFLLLAEDGQIQGVNLSSTATNPLEAISRILNVSAHDIDYDAQTEMIYWTRPETGEIWSSPLNDTTGKSRSVINTDITLVRPTAIAVDWMSRLLYYTEWKGTSSAISVISFDGTMQMKLIDRNLTEPASIEVDPETGYMFWTDTGVYPRVELAYMNGENRRSVYPEGFVQLPTAVTFNRRDRMIFHCDAKADIILGIPLDLATSLVSNKRFQVRSVDVHPFSLATVGDDVYFADHNLRGVWRWTTTSSSANRIFRTKNVPFALQFYDDKRVTTPATANACANENGGCAQMCLAVPGGRRCGCSAWDTSDCLPIIVNGSSGVNATIGDSLPCRYESVSTTGIEVTHVEWWLDGDMTQLFDVDNQLNDTSYVATKSGTYRCVVYNPYGSATSSSIFVPPPPPPTSPPPPKTTSPPSTTTSPPSTTTSPPQTTTSPPPTTTSPPQTTTSPPPTTPPPPPPPPPPDQFLLIGEVDTIVSASLGATASERNSVYAPISAKGVGELAFDAANGLVYWGRQAGGGGGIYRAYLNGTSPDGGEPWFSDVKSPGGIAIDWVSRLLYYVDRDNRSISAVDMNDPSRRIALISTNLQQPVDVAVDPILGYMAWTDQGKKTVEIAYTNGERRETLPADVRRPSGVAFDRKKDVIFYSDTARDHIYGYHLDTKKRMDGFNTDTKKVDIHPNSIDVYGTKLYFTDHNLRGVWRWSMKTAGATKILQTRSVLAGVVVYDSTRTSGTTGCSANNGGCPQICHSVPEGRRCSCVEGSVADCLPKFSSVSTPDVAWNAKATFSCTFPSTKEVGISYVSGYWMKNGNVLKKFTATDLMTTTTMTMTITKATSDDQGKYWCKLVNKYGTTETSKKWVDFGKAPATSTTPPPSTTASPPSPSGSSAVVQPPQHAVSRHNDSKVAAIVAPIVCVLLLLGILIVVVAAILRRRRQSKNISDKSSPSVEYKNDSFGYQEMDEEGVVALPNKGEYDVPEDFGMGHDEDSLVM